MAHPQRFECPPLRSGGCWPFSRSTERDSKWPPTKSRKFLFSYANKLRSFLAEYRAVEKMCLGKCNGQGPDVSVGADKIIRPGDQRDLRAVRSRGEQVRKMGWRRERDSNPEYRPSNKIARKGLAMLRKPSIAVGACAANCRGDSPHSACRWWGRGGAADGVVSTSRIS